MESYDLLVINGLVVTASDVGHYDIAIKDEKIALLAPKGSLAEILAKKVIDAEGGYVMPGGVDAHVHLDEPPLFGKGKSADNYETGTRSAICGGTTTLVRLNVRATSSYRYQTSKQESWDIFREYTHLALRPNVHL